MRTRLAVVGQERGGFLVVAVGDAAGTRTYVNLLETKALLWTPLLAFDGKPDVVWASVNADRSLVAYTLRSGPDSEWFDSFVEAVGEGKRLPLHERTRTPQRAQFLFDVPAKQAVSATLLVTVVCESLLLYTASCQRSAVQGGLNVLKAVKRDQQLVGPHLWSGLTQRIGALHYVVPKPAKDRAPPQQLLRTVFLGSRKAMLKQTVLEQPFSACVAMPVSGGLSIAMGTFPLPYTLGVGTKQVAPLPYVRHVSLEGGACCLCVQHEFAVKDGFQEPAIPITIIAFHLRLRIDFTIPLAAGSVTYDVLKTMRVIFDSIADFLVIYVPGHHLHLFDIGEFHNPIPGVVVTELDATPLPSLLQQSQQQQQQHRQQQQQSQTPQEVTVSAIDLANVSEQRAGPDVAGHTFLDLSSGVVFEFSFDRKRLLQMFETPNSEMHIQLLHTACIHMEDMELVHQTIMHVLNTNPENAKVSLLKEFIVGAAFQSLRGRVPYSVLLGVPATTSDQAELLQQSLRRKSSLDNVFVTPIQLLPTLKQTPQKDKDPPYPLHRIWAVLERSRQSQMPVSTRVEPRPSEDGAVLEYFRSLFGGSSSIAPPSHPFLRLDNEPVPRVSTDTRADAMNEHVVTVLAAALLEDFPRETKAAAISSAQTYVRCLNEQAEVLFTYIVQSFSDRPDPKQRLLFFQALENMFCAVTELGGIPLPRGFLLKFALLSFECLSETLFLQYVERGVIKVTTEVVCELQGQGLHERRPEFFYHLLCKLAESDAAAVLLNQPQLPLFLVEHFLSKNPQLLVSSKSLDLDAYCEDSPFIPLSLLTKLVQLQSQQQQQSASPATALLLQHASSFSFLDPAINFQ